MQTEGPAVHFLNLEYFFRIIYNLLHSSGSVSGGVTTPGLGFGGLLAFFSGLWLFLTIVAYLFCLAAIGVLVYATMRIYQVRNDEAHRFRTVSAAEEHLVVEHSRWAYIMQLVENGQETDWRQAIIESDIMLDEILIRYNYPGDSLGERLRSANPNHFKTLSNAWEAHKVRNEIAHQGSSYQLTERVAHRTIANYEAVFREFGEI